MSKIVHLEKQLSANITELTTLKVGRVLLYLLFT